MTLQPQTTKALLRKQARAARDSLSVTYRESLSKQITQRVIARTEFTAATRVLGYCSFGSEFATGDLLLNAVTGRKRLYLPRIDRAKRHLEIFELRDLESDLTRGPWGIQEPRLDQCRKADISEIDLVIVPGVAFTRRGDRLGYGAGYYDRLLARRRAGSALLAPAFSMQIANELAIESHDVRIDLVVTEVETFAAPSLV